VGRWRHFKFLVCVLDPQLKEAADLASALGLAAGKRAGADVLIDDRNERPGSSSRTPTWSASVAVDHRRPRGS